MKSAWTIYAYVKSEMPLTSKIPSVMQFTFMVFGDEKPTKELIEAFVSTHCRNIVLLLSEIAFTPIPDELLADM